MWTCPNCGRTFKRTYQDHYCGQAPASIDEYIERQEDGIQPALVCLRNAIRDAIPEAEETIAWSMPTWKRKGYLIHFAASKNHVGLYVAEEAVAAFEERLTGFETRKGVIRLKHGQEMPLALIADIAQWCWNREQQSSPTGQDQGEQAH